MATQKEHLTKKFIGKLENPEKNPVYVWDTELKGFGIKLNPTSMIFIVQARVNGKTRRYSIGEYGTWTVDQARKKAQNVLVNMANGIDPNQEKRAEIIKSKTLEEVQKDYLKDRDLKPSSIRDYNKHLNGIFKKWKDQPIANINRDEVMRLFRKASESSKAQANQAFRLLRALFNYAIEAYRPGGKPTITENPVNVLSGAKMWHNVKEKSRRIPNDLVGKAWNHLERLRKDFIVSHSARSMADAVAFCFLTGARWGEVQTLTWDNVNLKNETWHIDDPKNRNSITLPLSSQAKKILEERQRIEDNDYVFSSSKSETGYIGPGRYITDKIADKIGILISPHDLRRTFRAIAGECGIELWKTKLLMNHKLNQDVTISAYTETSDLRYLKDDIQKIGDWIERQGKIAASEKVVDLDQARKKAI